MAASSSVRKITRVVSTNSWAERPLCRTTATAVKNDKVRPELPRNCSMHAASVPGLPRTDSSEDAPIRTAT